MIYFENDQIQKLATSISVFKLKLLFYSSTATGCNNSVWESAFILSYSTMEEGRTTRQEVENDSLPLLRSSSSHRLRPLSRSQDNLRIRGNFLVSLRNMTNRSNVMLCLALLLSLAQISVTIAALVVDWHKECDRPLPFYLMFYGVRLFIQFPFIFQAHSNRSSNDELSGGSYRERLSGTLQFFGVIVFFFGNWWLASSRTCSSTSPFVYYTSLSFVLLGYLYLAIPCLLLLAVLGCLPCLLIAVAATRRHKNDGALEEEIQKIPEEKYSARGPIASEDAVCVICLGEYEEGDSLSRLACKHHFHRPCIGSWLRVNKTCPLCLRRYDQSAEATAATEASESTQQISESRELTRQTRVLESVDSLQSVEVQGEIKEEHNRDSQRNGEAHVKETTE